MLYCFLLQVENGSESFALNLCWIFSFLVQRPGDPLLSLVLWEVFIVFVPKAIKISHVSPSLTTRCYKLNTMPAVLLMEKQDGDSVKADVRGKEHWRGGFFPTECKKETETWFFLIVGGKDNPVIVMFQSLQCVKVHGVLLPEHYVKRSSVEQEKIRRPTWRLILVSCSNKHFNPEKRGKIFVCASNEFIFKITRMLAFAVAREEVFNTISYALSQVSVHLLHLLHLSRVNRSLFGTDHYNDFEVNLMNQKNQIGRKLLQKYKGKRVFISWHSFIFSCY